MASGDVKGADVLLHQICRESGLGESKLYQITYVIVQTVSVLLSVLQMIMLVRAILSWFPIDEDSSILRFVMLVTEPVILPVRTLFDRFGWFEGMPIDMSFFVTFLLLSLLRFLVRVPIAA